MKLKIFALLALPLLCGTITSCVPLAVGAAGGYLLNEEGYEVRSPITEE